MQTACLPELVFDDNHGLEHAASLGPAAFGIAPARHLALPFQNRSRQGLRVLGKLELYHVDRVAKLDDSIATPSEGMHFGMHDAPAPSSMSKIMRYQYSLRLGKFSYCTLARALL